MDNQGKTHSKLPWKMEGIEGQVTDPNSSLFLSDKENYIVGVMGYTKPAFNDRANAELIVTAVNSHLELLEACKEALEYIEDIGYNTNPLTAASKLVYKLESAIKKATNNKG